MTTKPNVVIIHDGDQDYLKTALARARAAGNIVAHLGFDRISDGWPRFGARHMATHPHIFELRCFQRFFVMQQFMQDYLVKDEYETRFGRKHIVFRDGQSWCRNLKSGEWVRFRSLHFQGHIKAQMARVAQGRGLAYAPLIKERAKNLARRLLRRG